MKRPKVDNSGVERAQRATAAAQEAANALQENFQTDLKTENLTEVVPGEVETADTSGTPRRRRQTGGLSSQLGINV